MILGNTHHEIVQSAFLLEHVLPMSAQTYDDDDEQGNNHVHPDVVQIVDVYLGV